MLTALSLVLALLGGASTARARLSDEHTYSYDQIWRAAVRMIAVDFRFPITDRDPEIGYLLFEYRDQGRSFDGSVELVRARGSDGSERVRVVVQVAAQPSYVERMILDRFRRKLSDDYGAAPVARPAPRPTPAPPTPAPAAPPQDEAPTEPAERS